jgi:anti-sigma regulatory factor (Ser/Thr protein kinase)
MGGMMTTQDDPYLFQSVLKPLPEAAREARDLIGTAFTLWGLEPYDARLVVTELFSNAAKASPPDGHIVVRAYLRSDRPILEVWDQSPDALILRPMEDDAETGRGLFVIDAYATNWGVRPLDEGGKLIWAELPRVETRL